MHLGKLPNPPFKNIQQYNFRYIVGYFQVFIFIQVQSNLVLASWDYTFINKIIWDECSTVVHSFPINRSYGFLLYKIILRQREAQSCVPFDVISVTQSTKGSQVWTRAPQVRHLAKHLIRRYTLHSCELRKSFSFRIGAFWWVMYYKRESVAFFILSKPITILLAPPGAPPEPYRSNDFTHEAWLMTY